MNFAALTAAQKAKYLVLVDVNRLRDSELPPFTSGGDIDAHYQHEHENDDGYFQDGRNEARNGIEAPEIDTPSSNHYEVDAHVGKLPDGSYVGWWFYYGGGKHGQPEYAIDWVSDAFDVHHKAEEITTTKHTFTKA
jgi:hypothetical protein